MADHALKFLRTLAIEAAFLGCLYAWKVLGVEGAGNLVAAWLWLGAAVGILMWIYGAVGNKDGSPLKQPNELAASKVLRAAADIFAVLALVWFGHIGLALLIGVQRFGTACYQLSARRTAQEG
jgi:hypothetical protein